MVTKSKTKTVEPIKDFFSLQIQGSNAKVLKLIFDTLASFSSIGVLKITDEKIECQFSYQGSVFLYTEISKSFFAKYDLNLENNQFKFPFDNFGKYLTVESNDSIININFLQPDNFISLNVQNSNSIRDFKIKLHVIDDDDKKDLIQLKSIPLPMEVFFTPGNFHNLIKEFKTLLSKDNSKAMLSYSNKDAKLFIRNVVEPEADEINIELKFDISNSSENKDYLGSYDLEYISKFLKLDVLKKTSVEFGNDKPIRIIFSQDDLSILFMEAPLVDEDQDEDDSDEEFSNEDEEFSEDDAKLPDSQEKEEITA